MQTKQSKTKYSVIGYYPDNDQTYSECIEAESEADAVKKLAGLIKTTVVIVAVVPGCIQVNDGLEYTVEVNSEESVEGDS